MNRYYRRQILTSLGFALPVGLLSQRLWGQTNSAPPLDPATMTWDSVVEQSRGTTVNWAMWSGSDVINRFADEWVGKVLKERYDITLKRIPLTDTVEAVNKVVGEVQAGLTTGGSIDLIWINGENFRTLKQGNLLFGPFRQILPSNQFYSPDQLAVNLDFGLPIEGLSAPYTGSYYIMAMDTAKVSTPPPQTYTELLRWAQANPGRFAYVAPPAFDGSRFLLTALYAVTGGYEQYAGSEFKQSLWDQNVDQVFQFLQDLEPYLWRKGQTYPPTQARLYELFVNGEIWMMPVFISRIAEKSASGEIPKTTQAFSVPGVSLNDPSFTAIPINASNPGAAMILADLLAGPEGQLQKFDPKVWGDPPLIDVSRLPNEIKAKFQATESQYGIPLNQLTANTVPVVNAEYTTRLETEWERRIAS